MGRGCGSDAVLLRVLLLGDGGSTSSAEAAASLSRWAAVMRAGRVPAVMPPAARAGLAKVACGSASTVIESHLKTRNALLHD